MGAIMMPASHDLGFSETTRLSYTSFSKCHCQLTNNSLAGRSSRDCRPPAMAGASSHLLVRAVTVSTLGLFCLQVSGDWELVREAGAPPWGRKGSQPSSSQGIRDRQGSEPKPGRAPPVTLQTRALFLTSWAVPRHKNPNQKSLLPESSNQ